MLKGEKPGKTPEVAYIFFGQRAENDVLSGLLADAFLMAKSESDVQKQGAKRTLREKKVTKCPVFRTRVEKIIYVCKCRRRSLVQAPAQWFGAG